MKTELYKALELIRVQVAALKDETADINDIQSALGRTLAVDITAENDYPPFSRSPYDGYSFRAEDLKEHETLDVIGVSYAGKPFEGELNGGQAIKIMTGGAIPLGADCVVPWEKTDRGEKRVKVYSSPRPYENYIKQGEDFLKGDVLLKRDTVIHAPQAALMRAGGVRKAKVRPVVRAAVISTGDEIAGEGEVLGNGSIYDTNLIYFTYRLKELGAEVVYTDSLPDDSLKLAEGFLKAMEIADVLFTTGGVSAGEKDLVPEALEKMGADIVFRGINIKPGMPTVFSKAQNGVPILSLSGNPFAAAVAFELVGREILYRLTGNEKFIPPRKEALMKNGYDKSGSMERYVKAFEKDGYVTVPKSQGNGSLRSMTECNCLVRIPSGSEGLRAGERAEIIYV